MFLEKIPSRDSLNLIILLRLSRYHEYLSKAVILNMQAVDNLLTCVNLWGTVSALVTIKYRLVLLCH